LRQHSRLRLYPGKEAHFFDTESKFRAAPDYASYHAAFEEAPVGTVFGEASPVYMYWPGAIQRIRDYNPSCRIIVRLRAPMRRAWSHWQMSVRTGQEPLGFSDAIRCEEERIQEALSPANRHHSYLNRGRYSGQIERLRVCFPSEQLLFLKSEDFLPIRRPPCSCPANF
jgi:hypothetical protein